MPRWFNADVLAQLLTARGHYTAVMLSVEMGAVFSDQPGKAEKAILGAWRSAAQHRLPPELHPPQWPEAEDGLNSAEQSPTPLVYRTVLEACHLTRLLNNWVLVMHT
jgi:hypothetical protein